MRKGLHSIKSIYHCCLDNGHTVCIYIDIKQVKYLAVYQTILIIIQYLFYLVHNSFNLVHECKNISCVLRQKYHCQNVTFYFCFIFIFFLLFCIVNRSLTLFSILSDVASFFFFFCRRRHHRHLCFFGTLLHHYR